MKKILLLFITLFSLSVSAQIYTINPQLKLNTVSQGTANDSLLVRGEDNIIKYVPQSSIQGTMPTGLEAIDEGNGIGWRLIGADPMLYGHIGSNSVDLTLVDPYESIPEIGVQAEASFSAGVYNKITGGGYAVALGSANTISSSSYVNTALGGYNKIVSGYGNTVIGVYNESSTKANGFSTLLGMNNRASGNFPAGAVGIALDVRSRNQFAVGAANTIWGGDDGATDRPIFTVGNGAYTTPAGPWQASVRSDAFVVRNNGVAELPSVTTALINSGTSKTVPTKEYVHKVIEQSKIEISRPYTSYTVLISQISTGAPIPISVLENTTGYTYTYSRVAPGEYTLTPSSPLNPSKVSVNIGQNNVTADHVLFVNYEDTPHLVRIKTRSFSTGSLIDDALNGNLLEIRIYE